MRFARAVAGVERHAVAAASHCARSKQAVRELLGFWIQLGMAVHGLELHIRQSEFDKQEACHLDHAIDIVASYGDSAGR